LLSKEKVVLTPKQAIQKIGDESGIRFDPDVVNAFLRVWRRKELEVAPGIP
jgi:response regulator RpfG family c-di-GMP phosphodiesterase